jgi:hypothetical protein
MEFKTGEEGPDGVTEAAEGGRGTVRCIEPEREVGAVW